MNRFERGPLTEARVRYLDHDFQVVMAGSYVVCAISGDKIPLDQLMYWSVARQEPYSNAAASLAREIDKNPELRKRS